MLPNRLADRNLINGTRFIGELNALPRAVKQLCGISRFMVRTTEAIHTHIFCRSCFPPVPGGKQLRRSIRAFTQLELMRAEELIEKWYEVQKTLYLQVARGFILEHLTQKLGLNAYNRLPVNA